jgi:hypothetical protein
MTHEQVLAEMDAAWAEVLAFIGAHSTDVLTTQTDAGGWSVKDHIAHLGVWALLVIPLVGRGDRLAVLGVSQETFDAGYDPVNAVIRDRLAPLLLGEVVAFASGAHAQVRAFIAATPYETLMRPHREFVPGSTHDDPIGYWVAGNTFGHYREHLAWMRAIVGEAAPTG